MAQLKIHLFGAFQVSLDSVPLTKFDSNKVRALLAYLVVESSQAHRREKLDDLFWPETPPQRAGSNLSQALYNLRMLLDDPAARQPCLLRVRGMVQFNPDADAWVDVHAFNACFAAGREANVLQPGAETNNLADLQAAVELYRGDFLEGLVFDSSLAFDEWILIVRQRLQRQALRALHRLGDHYRAAGDPARALPYAWRQVELDPLNEPACRQLMRLLAADGQRSKALAQFERLQAMLKEELGVAPETDTQALGDRIRTEVGATIQVAAPRDNLPAFVTPFIGRRAELDDLVRHLVDPGCRLLTVLGSGGSGKSHLAVQAARQCRVHFPHGACFVSLNPVQSVDSILPAIAAALDLPLHEVADLPEQIAAYLREKELLLVLDGCEHLLAGAHLLVALLHQAPGLKLLATSRVRLGLKGEFLYPLGGMAYPPGEAPLEEVLEADAVRLLLSALGRVRPGFQPQPQDAAHLLAICRGVQGMPLGLLLAASWGATLSLAEIAAEIGRELDFLSAEWADLPARQRSLRATFDHTWNLLTGRERELFQCLAVFQGSFTRRAAREVCGASTHELRALVERALLWSQTPGRYEMHALLCQYGREKLAQDHGREGETRSRHSVFYLARLERWGVDLKGPQQAAALANIDREHENIRAAWNWVSGQGAAGQLGPVVEALCLYYDLGRRYPEGASACQAAIAGGVGEPAAAGEPMQLLHLAVWQSRFIRLLEHASEASTLRAACQSRLDRAAQAGVETRFIQALLAFESGETAFEQNLVKARAHYRSSLELLEPLEQPWWSARVLLKKALCDLRLGDFSAAGNSFRYYLDELSAGADLWNRANALERLAFLQVRRGELELSMQYMQEAVSVFRSLGDPASYAASLTSLGLLLAWHGRFQESFDLLSQSLPIYQELGDRLNLALIPVSLGMMLVFQGRYAEAETWLQKGIPLGQAGGQPRTVASAQMARGWMALRAGDYERAGNVLRESVELYRQISFLDELGWALAALAQARFARGDFEAGIDCLRESLQIGVKIGAEMTVRYALGPGALLLARQGDPAQALALYSLAIQNPNLAEAHWFHEVYGQPISRLARELSAAERAAARAQGQQLDLWQTAAELLEGLRAETG